MEFLPSLAATVLLALGILILVWHAAIDLKLRILPDELTIGLIIIALLFHWTAYPYAGSWQVMLMGALVGGGGLALVRTIANRLYGFETMGLGDVKLLFAFGLWLGPAGVLYALVAGAMAGVVHGLLVMLYARVKAGETLAFREMTIPAGPGFCAGAIIAAFWQFRHIPFFGG